MHDTTPDPFHADFEAAVIKVCDEAGADEPNLAFKHGAYTDPLIQSAWWAWNASREALVVELTAEYELPPTMDLQSLVTAIRKQDIATIEAQGLKVKP